MLWFGVRLVLNDRLTSGALLVFVLYLGKLYKPMKDLSKTTDTLSKAAVSFERIGEILALESQVRDRPGARPAPRFTGVIEFANVTFGYSPDHLVLKGVDLAIEEGQRAALVGLTGSGKSTLIGLIARLYDTLGGSISIDGRDVRQYTLESLREQVSFVLQEPVLFRATIAQNIAYGRPGAAFEDIVRAARLANADEFIADCRNGTTRSSASAAIPCPAASASASRSPARSSATPRFSCSTSRRRPSTPNRRSPSFRACRT